MKDVNELLEYEKKELLKGNTLIAGVDEVGRGPLAGPVVTAAVIMDLDNLIDGVDDSKKLSEKKREMLYDEILKRAKAVQICEADNNVIDQINILEATKKCMANSILNLEIKPEVVLVDAVKLEGLGDIKQEAIIKGDSKSYNIACASIVAKVYRDRLMASLDDRYPGYNFKKHKGYGTKEHILAIKEIGPCEIHRKSFIKNFVGENNV